MHKALYRKYRPQVFEDVIGQDYIVTVLKNQIESGRVGHAYLFTGTRGTGKTTCAKIFSKAVNCEHNQNGNPCLSCDVCKGVQNGSILDIVEIDAASNTGVDNIRDIIEESAFLPAVCKYRVYIIDEVHMLSTNAFNALLKIMEEPPAHVIFILATTEVHQVPVTIISRCQRFDFSRIDDELIVNQLLKVANLEGINLSNDAAEMIAALADGGLRDALSLFDQCASFDNNVDRNVVSKVSGQAEGSFINALADTIVNKNAAEALKLIKKAHSTSLSQSFIAAELITLMRNAMVCKAAGKGDKSLYKIGTDLERVSFYAEKLSLGEIINCIDVLSEALNSLSKSSFPDIVFEKCMIKLCTPSLSSDDGAILSRIEALEKRLISVPSSFSPFSDKVKAEPKVEALKTEIPPQKIEEPKKEIPQIKELNAHNGEFALWNRALEILSTTNAPLFGALRASKAYLENDVVYIDTNDFTFALLKGSENNRDTLKKAVAEASGKPYRIAQYKGNKSPQKPKSDAMAEILKRAERNGVDVNM